MSRAFYLSALRLGLVLAAAAACSQETAEGDGGGDAGAAVFTAAYAQPAYPPPPGGDLLGRYIDNLDGRSREGLRFAKERIGEYGELAADRLVERIRAAMLDERQFAVLHNYCETLGRTQQPEAAEVLVEVLAVATTPVVRTAAIDSIRYLGARDRVPDLVAQLDREVERAPRLAIVEALGQLGGAAAGDELERIVAAWLAGEGDPEVGPAAWNSLLLLDDGLTAERLRRTLERLSPEAHPLRVQLVVALVDLGETELAQLLVPYVDPARFPSAAVRGLAVTGLALAGDWTTALRAAEDPDTRVQLALVSALERDAAAGGTAGEDFLLQAARETPLDAMLHDELALNLVAQALAVLVARGDRRELEPWLRLLQGYPDEPGSVQALLLLKEKELFDARTPPILAGCWQRCEGSQRIDVLRALGLMRDPAVLPFFEEVIRDNAVDEEVRTQAIVTLANFGAAAWAPMLRTWESGVARAREDLILGGIASLAVRGVEPARELLVRLATDPGTPDLHRKIAIELLPKALRQDSWALLLAARDAEQRREVRSFLDAVLLRYF